MQDSSNPFSHHVLPTAGACNNKMLCGRNTTKTKEAMHHITPQENALMPKQISLCTNQIKAYNTTDEKKGGKKTGTATICILQIPLNLRLVEPLVQENPPLFGKCELPTLLVFYISLVGPWYVLLIWQYFLPQDIFMAAP